MEYTLEMLNEIKRADKLAKPPKGYKTVQQYFYASDATGLAQYMKAIRIGGAIIRREDEKNMTHDNTLPYIIAIDFDGTLCEECWPAIGPAREDIIGRAKAVQAAGAKLILWTCRTGEPLQEAVAWCAAHGLQFDGVNANLPEREEFYGGKTRKISADEYWDDKAVRV